MGAIVVFVLFTTLVLRSRTQEFSCDITYTNPSAMVNNGALLGNIHYSWTNANILLDFPATASRPHYSELYSFNLPKRRFYDINLENQLIYRIGNCNNCEIGHLNSVMPVLDMSNPLFMNYFKQGKVEADGCHVYTRKSHVPQLLVRSISIGHYFPCSLTWNDGIQWNFTNCKNSTFPASFFHIPDSCKCGKALDIAIAVDTSESISQQEQIDQQDFLRKFIGKFELSPMKVNIAIVQFSSTAWVSLAISEGLTQENVATAITTLGCKLPCTEELETPGNSKCAVSSDQTTCCCGRSISAGVRMAADQLKLGRSIAKKVLIVLTNGYHDTLFQIPGPGPECGSDQAACTQDLIDADTHIFSVLGTKNIGIFAVGIGSEILSDDELNIIADSKQKVIRKSSFSELSSDYMELLSRVCNENSRPCGDCCGLCSCGTCYPPDTCLQSTPCRPTRIPENGTCCSDTNITCVEMEKLDSCHTYMCDDNSSSATAGKCIINSTTDCGNSEFPECFHRICDSNLPESIPFCTNFTECTVANASLDCDDQNQCTIESCGSAGICEWQLIDCAQQGYIENKCVDVTCLPESGCRYISKLERNPQMCDDHNLCTSDYCDPSRGCVHDDVLCSDYNPCTVDTCDPFHGCIFVPITCMKHNTSCGACGISSCNGGVCNSRSVPCVPTTGDIPYQESVVMTLGSAGIISIIIASLLCIGGIVGCGVYAKETTKKKSPNPVFIGSAPKRNPMYSKT